MRDPDRIPEILALVEKVWNLHPDMRFCQLVSLVAQWANYDDPFYCEDDKVMEALKLKLSLEKNKENAK